MKNKQVQGKLSKLQIGDVVAFNKLPDAVWFDVLAIDGFVMTIREHDTDYATQQMDKSCVVQIKTRAI